MKRLPIVWTYALIFFIIAALLVIRLLLYGGATVLHYWLPVVEWVVGGALGYLALDIDRLIDIYYTNPQSRLAQAVRPYFLKGRYREGWKLLQANRHLQRHLTFHSALFQVVWVALAVFTMTSTLSVFGQAFVLGLGLHLLLLEWHDYLLNPTFLTSWLFWQVAREVNSKDLKKYLAVVTAVTAFLFGLFVRLIW